jgi:hypothetical protein
LRVVARGLIASGVGVSWPAGLGDHRVVAEDDARDWRLMGQATWLAGRELQWRDWTAYRPGWDHDHCAFCWAEIASVATDHAPFTAGYVTTDDHYTWICSVCFADFKDSFGWTVAPASADSS